MYEELYARLPATPTAEALANEYADKEIRVLMSQNGMLINDLDPNTGRYACVTPWFIGQSGVTNVL